MNPALPPHLVAIRAVAVDTAVADSPLARRVRARLPHLPLTALPPGQAPPEAPGRTLHLTAHKGRFLRPCPAAGSYRCCDLAIVHTGEGCPLSCTYCILRAYLQGSPLTVFANQEGQFAHLAEAFSADPTRRFRVGMGQFADSLALEPLTGAAGDMVDFLKDFPNVCLELKSKVADLSWMARAARPDRVLASWSVNAPEVVEIEEPGAASLEERLGAARECARAGFRVCLHFDPVILYPGWRAGYARSVEMILDHLRPRDVAYVSLGSFRFLPGLAGIIADNPRYHHGEYAQDLDGKRRLLRPLRVTQLRFLADRLARGGLARALYLCMESDDVWREVFGRAPGSPGELAARLMARAFGEAYP